jgi:hypothetical protein
VSEFETLPGATTVCDVEDCEHTAPIEKFEEAFKRSVPGALRAAALDAALVLEELKGPSDLIELLRLLAAEI